MKYWNKFECKHLTLAVVGVSALALTTGCRTSHQHAQYSQLPAPVVAAGGSESTSQSEYRSDETYSANANVNANAGVSASAGVQQQSSDQTVIPLYQETVRAGTREVEAGTVRLRKIVKTETVNQPVQVRRETVVIDRTNGGNVQSSNAGQPFQEQEYVIHLKREEPVFEKQVQQVGEIVARKQVQSQQQNVQGQIRRDEIDVVKQGNAQDVTISADAQALINSGASGGSSQFQGEDQSRGQRRSDQP
jgi:stress response protein YsnF